MKNFLINLTLIFFISSCTSFVSTEDLPPPPTDYWKQVYQELNTSDGGHIKYYDTNCYGSDGKDCDIVVIKHLNDRVQWETKIGGNSWDYVEDILEVDNGYLVLGQTSSYGVGNNDVYLTKLDLMGNELWFRTHGDFLNDYGRLILPSNDNESEYIIKGEQQNCPIPIPDDWVNCYMKELLIKINSNGREIYKVLSEFP